MYDFCALRCMDKSLDLCYFFKILLHLVLLYVCLWFVKTKNCDSSSKGTVRICKSSLGTVQMTIKIF